VQCEAYSAVQYEEAQCSTVLYCAELIPCTDLERAVSSSEQGSLTCTCHTCVAAEGVLLARGVGHGAVALLRCGQTAGTPAAGGGGDGTTPTLPGSEHWPSSSRPTFTGVDPLANPWHLPQAQLVGQLKAESAAGAKSEAQERGQARGDTAPLQI